LDILEEKLAAAYSPTPSQGQYHRRMQVSQQRERFAWPEDDGLGRTPQSARKGGRTECREGEGAATPGGRRECGPGILTPF